MTQPLLLAMPDSDIAPVTEDAVVDHDPRRHGWRTGAIVERLFEVAALQRGYEVSANIGGGKDFDYIVRLPGGRPIVIQIKTAWLLSRQGKYHINNKTRAGVYSATAYDVLAVFLSDRNQWLFYLRTELGDRTASTYTPRDARRRQRKSHCGSHGDLMADRDPDNWHLLAEFAAQPSQ